MPALLAAVLLFASPDEGAPRVPTVTSSASHQRKSKMAILFRRNDAFFPAYCVAGGKVRAGNGCLSVLPRAPLVRLMDGRRVQLEPLARHDVSAWDGPKKKGYALREADVGADVELETELAVWPPDANPGLEPLPSTLTPVDLEGLRALPDAEALPVDKPANAKPSWPPTLHQAVPAGKKSTAVVVSGVRRGLYLETPMGWRAVRPEGAAEVGTSLIGVSDIDGDGRPEWLIHIKGWNEFGLEVRPHDLGKPLFEFNDCGV